ncbi:L-dopachrome tautomerase-related protein [Spirosoma sp.]|uniref:SMP-30/gluconolactonase/LRE family protein n=1 Tax=Spirosoma sp. TaxID=1899569 RepID=UPI00261B578B|nr:L-dopachrome tautomerase-related protein [Spirosoma sp.]
MVNGNGQSGRQMSDVQLISAYQSNMIWNGVTITDHGRVFVCFPRQAGEAGLRVGEIRADGKVVPYPDEGWNTLPTDRTIRPTFVRVRSLRIGPDHNLWVVDTGYPQAGPEPVTRGAKVIVIEVETNQVIRIIPLDDVVNVNSLVDDVRITPSHIYLTDAGAPALVVLDRQSGRGRRILENDDSVTDMRPILAEGQIMRYPNGEEVCIHADQLEVSPDGKYLYFQPASGLMSRIDTFFLNDTTLSPGEVAKQVQLFVDTPGTGGTTIDADGNIYLSDINQLRILKITPAGKTSTLVADSRLVWVGSMWIDQAGFLWLPAGQLNRTATFQQGKSAVVYPVHLYKLQIGATPVRN